MINFGTVDSKKFGGLSQSLIYLIITPISGIIGIIYLYIIFGYSIFTGIFLMCCLMGLNYIYVKRGIKY